MSIRLNFELQDPELIDLWTRLVKHAKMVESERASFYENSIDTEWSIHARRGIGPKSPFVFFTKIATSDLEVEETSAHRPFMMVYTSYEVNLEAPLIWRNVAAADLHSDSCGGFFERIKESFRSLLLAARTNVLQPDADELRHLIGFIEQSHRIDHV